MSIEADNYPVCRQRDVVQFYVDDKVTVWTLARSYHTILISIASTMRTLKLRQVYLHCTHDC